MGFIFGLGWPPPYNHYCHLDLENVNFMFHENVTPNSGFVYLCTVVYCTLPQPMIEAQSFNLLRNKFIKKQ